MKEQLIKYGFSETNDGFAGWIKFEKNGWTFEYYCADNYMYFFAPNGGDEDGICVHELTYESIIKLVEFLSEYK